MKIAIVYYSYSGHTMQFAKAIQKKFNDCGHQAEIFYLRTIGRIDTRTKKVQLKEPPEIQEFDAALFGTPVWAFKCCPVLIEYLEQLKDFKNRKAMGFVCKGLPFDWTGGTQALKEIDKWLDSNLCDILPGEMLHCAFKMNQTKLNETVERIYSKFTAGK